MIGRRIFRRGRILRIRPGPLANFSGGAGYMPFIVIFSVPASLIFWLVGCLLLFFKGRAAENRQGGERLPLTTFVRFAWWHFAVCALVTVVASAVLMSMAVNMVYSMEPKYVLGAFAFSVGPLLSWLGTTVLLLYAIYRRGARPWLLIAAGGLYALLTTACFFGGVLLS